MAGVAGVAGSPSCGIRRTLDLAGAVEAMAACALAAVDRTTFNREVIAANVGPGEGLFVHELRRALRRRGIQVPFQEHDLPLAMASRPGFPGAGPNRHPDPPEARRSACHRRDGRP